MGDLYDEHGKIVTAVLLLTPTSKKGNMLDFYKISSAEGRSHIKSLFTKEDGSPVAVRYVDKKRIQSWLNVNRLQLPLHNLDSDSKFSIRNDGTNVNKKFSDRDSEGNQLSKKQKEYFENSKVRDKNGNLLVMYHGTRNGGFTVFDRTKAGKKTGFAVYGRGNYFTAFKNGASNYGNRVISAYLKIEKPIITSAKSGAFTADVAEALGIKASDISSQTISERIKEAGYDGVVVYGIGEDEGNIVIPMKNIRREIDAVLDHARIAKANIGKTPRLASNMPSRKHGPERVSPIRFSFTRPEWPVIQNTQPEWKPDMMMPSLIMLRSVRQSRTALWLARLTSLRL